MKVELKKDEVDKLFEDARTAGEYVAAFYDAVIPHYSKIHTINQWVLTGREIGMYLLQKAIVWDKHHEINFAGYAWMNYGTGIDNSLGAWEVKFDEGKLQYATPLRKAQQFIKNIIRNI